MRKICVRDANSVHGVTSQLRILLLSKSTLNLNPNPKKLKGAGKRAHRAGDAPGAGHDRRGHRACQGKVSEEEGRMGGMRCLVFSRRTYTLGLGSFSMLRHVEAAGSSVDAVIEFVRD